MRRTNAEYRVREHLTEAEITKLLRSGLTSKATALRRSACNIAAVGGCGPAATRAPMS